ncbi:ribosylnicotinamide kinase [Marasmius tenuissimus]|uniref:Ribosylnicotinamide kinase n=1 Tax=Marasmius tenuissimus TaxID=585030 RepID=A0ABR2ZLZ3_9AGAR
MKRGHIVGKNYPRETPSELSSEQPHSAPGCMFRSPLTAPPLNRTTDDLIPVEKLPKDPEFGFENWDDPEGAVEWDRMANYLTELKKTGVLGEHHSVDSFNQNAAVPVDDEVISKWKKLSEKVFTERQSQGENLVWVIVDGFLLYWDERIVSTLDVKAFVRISEDVAKARREARSYYTPEGDTWRDPPQYWEKIVWPAYLKAHKHIFENGDVVAGIPKPGNDLIVLESAQGGDEGHGQRRDGEGTETFPHSFM